MLISTLSGPVEVPSTSRGLDSARKMADSTSPTPPAVKRACDGCHRRKVKCIGDGTRPCKNCTSAGLTCTYNAIPQKKGPKGSRAKVISELRENQRQSQLVAKQHGMEFQNENQSPAHIRRQGLLSMEMITTSVDYFFAHLYPTQPILHRQRVGETIGQMDTNTEAYCLTLSLCAYMMIQPNMVLPPGAFEGLEIPPQPSLRLGQLLLAEALRVRRGYNYIENPSVWSVITSFFLFGSYFCLDRHNTAWFHLREATTLAQIMGMNDEANYQTPDVVENSRRRRLYWLLFVTERAYALQQHKPLTLHATINLPTLDEDPAETAELNGFIHLVNLFRPFDDTFVGLWNKARVGCTTEWLARLQQQLSDALPTYLQCTETQAVDLRCSQQWLRTMVWQLSISHGFLSSAAADNAMSFNFPIEISRDLVQSASQFSKESMEVHGVGLIEKLFDVACTLTDVMSVIPQDQFTFGLGPRDYLSQLMNIISNLRGGQQRYLPLLMQKITGTIPNTAAYMIPAIPPSLRPEEIYDGNHSSAPTSGDSTPAFGSPLGSPLSSGVQLFGGGGYPDLNVTSAGHYGLPPASAPSPVYSTPAVHGPPSSVPSPVYNMGSLHGLPAHLTKYEAGG